MVNSIFQLSYYLNLDNLISSDMLNFKNLHYKNYLSNWIKLQQVKSIRILEYAGAKLTDTMGIKIIKVKFLDQYHSTLTFIIPIGEISYLF